MACWRQRLTVFLVSLIILFMEIVLMRELAMRFWEHLAWLVISIALLGFGMSGTLLVLLNRMFTIARPTLQLVALLGMSLSIPLCLWLGDLVDFNLIQLVWQPVNIWALGALELLWSLPFLFGGMFIGLVLEDSPENVPGHYAASFLGSGVGGIAALPALSLLPPRPLLLIAGVTVLGTGVVYVRGRSSLWCWIVTSLLMTAIVLQVPYNSKISEEKDLPQILAMPGSAVLSRRFGPQGLIEIVEAPAMHTAPGLALNSNEPVPPQRFITIDAQLVGSIYGATSPMEYAFLDHTTQALPYRLGNFSRVLIVGDSGDDQVGLALYHGTASVITLTDNSSLADLKRTEMSSFTGHLYQNPGVSVITATVRGFLRQSREQYPLIILPTAGNDPGGLTAASPDSLFTLETLRLCFDRLQDDGVLSVSTYLHQPPRESLRLLNMLAAALRERGKQPQLHLAMVRNWATATIVAQLQPLSLEQLSNIRSFCQQRGFDLVWLPDMSAAESNRFHLLERDNYYLGARMLLTSPTGQFASDYVYDISVPDDNRPFFHHFSRRYGQEALSHELGTRSRAFMELGTILLLAALCQAFLLALVGILLPLIPAIGFPGKKNEQLAILGFFIAIGLGFMLLEIGMLQRLSIYLAHPVYAAAIVLSSFLFFGGIGSTISSQLTEPLLRVHCGLGLAVSAIGAVILIVIDGYLALTESMTFSTRVLVAVSLIAPLAILMGMLFPLGMKRVGHGQAQLIPWAWGANGFASVLAALCGPLMAMQMGFDQVAWGALGCYCLAAVLSLRLPD